MTTAQLQELAKAYGININDSPVSQTKLIRNIQVLRGDTPCFSTDKRYDCTEDCEWRQDCRKLRAVWLR